MIKSRYFLSLAIILALFASCNNDDDLKEIFLKESGIFQATIKNSQSTPYANKKVSLFQENEMIHEVYTNEDGIADFEHVNKGNYKLKGVEFEEGGKQYSFARTIQVVVGETVNIDIIPSEYSGSLTIELFEQHRNSDHSYSELVKQNGGNLVLYDFSKLKEFSFESIKEIAITEQKIADDVNTVSFNKLPIGEYGLMYYTDSEHYQIFGSKRWDQNGNLINYGILTITKEADIREKLIIDGTKLTDDTNPDQTGTVTVAAFSYYQLGYSSKTEAKELKEGKIALIKGDIYSNSAFEQLKEMIVAEKELDGQVNTVEFNDVKVGQYSIMIYTDIDHYQIAKIGYGGSSTFFTVTKDEVVNNVVLVDHAKVKTVYKDQNFNVYKRNYETGYNRVGIKGATIFLLKNSVYNDLDYSFRQSKDVLKLFAMQSGITDDDGNLTLSSPSYVRVTAVVFDENGNYRTSDDFYPISVGDKEYEIY